MTKKMHPLFPWFAWGLGALFFGFTYFPRVAPSVIGDELMTSFQVGGTGLGGLSFFMMLGYVGMQLPVGILLDRFGTRRLMLLAVAIVFTGCVIFASAHHLIVAEMGRLMIGAAGAFSFIGAMKIANDWFPSNKLGLLAGLTQTFGMFAAAVGQAPFALLVAYIGWRYSMYSVSSLFIIVFVAMYFILHDHKSDKQQSRAAEPRLGLMESIIIVCKNKQSWLNAFYLGLVFAPVMIMGELWGVSFLERVHHATKAQAALADSAIFLGWAVGGPIAGTLSDRWGKRRPMMILSSIICLIILLMILYMDSLSLTAVGILLFLFGVTNTGVAVAYALSGEINPHEVGGTSIAFANMASIIWGSILEPIVGWLLDVNWDGQTAANGVRIYTVQDYHGAFVVLPIGLVLSIVFVFFMKETHCRHASDIFHHP